MQGIAYFVGFFDASFMFGTKIKIPSLRLGGGGRQQVFEKKRRQFRTALQAGLLIDRLGLLLHRFHFCRADFRDLF